MNPADGEAGFFSILASKRRTTYFFDGRPVPQPVLTAILESARQAPSPGNLQPFRFLVIRDPAALKKILATANYGAVHGAPSVGVAVVVNKDDYKRVHTYYSLNEKLALEQTYVGAGMAAISICFQAQDLGVSSCLLTCHEEKVRRLLRLEGSVKIPIVIGLGYPRDPVEENGKKARLPLKQLVTGL